MLATSMPLQVLSKPTVQIVLGDTSVTDVLYSYKIPGLWQRRLSKLMVFTMNCKIKYGKAFEE